MPPLDPEDPLDRGRFDRAVVLFNAGAFYDAHEDWEDLWHEAEGRERLDLVAGKPLQALIGLCSNRPGRQGQCRILVTAHVGLPKADSREH